ncbi:MAG: FAD-binding protein, partial [Anaerolineales bacterium]|nr:FAD-binding protein [Anaerolineales bacterium]
MPLHPHLHDFLTELRPRISGDLRTDEFSRVLYSTDASIYQVTPHAVLIPRTTEDVHAAVSLAARHRVPLLPRTGGSSLAGQAVNAALVIDFTRHLDHVLEIDPEARWVRVQPGIVLDRLNARLRPFHLQFGPDPASSSRAALGGIVSNNATGAHSIRYGMAADHVLEMDVLLSDGTAARFGPLTAAELLQHQRRGGLEGALYRGLQQLTADPAHLETIRRDTPRHWRRCGGYNLDRLVPPDGLAYRWPRDHRFNLAQLLAGAEGTLGVITALKLNLVPTPRLTALAIVQFDALRTALTAVPAILETQPAAVELLDNLGLTLCRDVPAYARLLPRFLEGEPHCVLITEFDGESEAELRAKIDGLRRHLRAQGAGETAVTAALDPQTQRAVWQVRKAGLGLLMSLKGDLKPLPFIEDAAVPVAHLPDYVAEMERFCASLGTRIAYYAHASAGCLHVRPLIDAKQAAEVAKLPEISQFAAGLLRARGGALSSEHGDGRARSWLNEQFFGPELYALFRQVKALFDPHNLLNPGNIVDAGPMTANLRFGPDYRFRPLTPHLDFSEQGSSPAGGFDRAIEMCNGAGQCRKLDGGTMCPSFMVTREELHSTRGRANLLRAVYTGRLAPSELAGQRLYEALDLCIECKACKAECPSSVDMAKLKFEFLAQRHDALGIPRRASLFGHVGDLSRLACGPQAPLLNWLARRRLPRALLARALGITEKRPLPTFARRSFMHWFNARSPRPAGAEPVEARSPQLLVLFVDPITNYSEPHVARAAVAVLEAAGWGVTAVAGEDGRPFISKGIVAGARLSAYDTLEKLAPYAARGVPIVGLEPSSLLTLRDEYAALLPDDPRVPLVAAHAFTFEEFLARQAEAEPLAQLFTAAPRRLLLHGHCHQKALVGTAPAHRALTLPANYAVQEVDAGCCGMAGAFGYEAEHYEVSLQMAERALLPAVRAAAAETLIVAAGLSCR